ncbi:MAG: hypothetical protein ACR2FN_09005 [Chitinophagaceae bacterium]
MAAEAYKTFTQNIDYLKREWSETEIKKFTESLNKIIERIKKYPESFAPSQKDFSVRKAKINKQITLYFRYTSELNKLELVTFWHNKQNPNKLKY